MPLFEFEDGHLIPAQFGRSVPGGITDDILNSVCDQVLEIIGRPLFPISWQQTEGDDTTPRLTALDASGQVVSVEVVQSLDSQTMIDSLSRLADTASLGWNDLAAQYPSGMLGFRAGWTEFRDGMPPSPAPGPRLILVTGSISESVRPALDVLASSGVEVHEIAVRQMSNGRQFIDVQAVGPRIYGHNPNLLLGSVASTLEIENRAERPEQPSSSSPTQHEDAQSEPHPPAEPAEVAEVAEVDSASKRDSQPRELDPEAPEVQTEPATNLDSATAIPTRAQARASRVRDEVPQLNQDPAGLEVIAEILGQDTPLVFKTVEDTHQAMLSQSGLISSVGWSTKDPNEAAAMVSGSSRYDGWGTWRLGDALGPTLAESLTEINREIRAEYEDLGQPVEGRRTRSHERRVQS